MNVLHLFSTRPADGSSQYDDPVSSGMQDLTDAIAMRSYASYSGIGTNRFSKLWDQVQSEIGFI